MTWGGGIGTNKTSIDTYEALLGSMSEEELKRYVKFLENGSTAGMTPEELLAIQKVDERLLLDQIDYDEVLVLRKGVSEGGSVTLQTGGRQIDYNAYIKRLETIDMEYENIRINTTDISKIAQGTGMPEWKISRIKEHVFSNEHILDSGVKRFEADPEIADAWYRLTNGTFNEND